MYTKQCTLILMKTKLKNITISFDEERLDELRRLAAHNRTTVNQLFREFSDDYIARQRQLRLKALRDSFKTLSITSDRKYSREEMNER